MGGHADIWDESFHPNQTYRSCSSGKKRKADVNAARKVTSASQNHTDKDAQSAENQLNSIATDTAQSGRGQKLQDKQTPRGPQKHGRSKLEQATPTSNNGSTGAKNNQAANDDEGSERNSPCLSPVTLRENAEGDGHADVMSERDSCLGHSSWTESLAIHVEKCGISCDESPQVTNSDACIDVQSEGNAASFTSPDVQNVSVDTDAADQSHSNSLSNISQGNDVMTPESPPTGASQRGRGQIDCKQNHMDGDEGVLYSGPMGTEYLESGRGFFLNEAMEMLWMIYPPEGTRLDPMHRKNWMRPMVEGEEFLVTDQGKIAHLLIPGISIVICITHTDFCCFKRFRKDRCDVV